VPFYPQITRMTPMAEASKVFDAVALALVYRLKDKTNY
jgi:hypothetical protein